MIRTSGRCRSTGSLLLSRAFRMSPIAMGDDSALIFCLASSSHALTSAIRALSPCPKSAVTLASGRGCASGVGRDSTDNDSASRVNPWASTRGSASFSSLALETNASQPSRSVQERDPHLVVVILTSGVSHVTAHFNLCPIARSLILYMLYARQ